jgi:hypothetical protein
MDSYYIIGTESQTEHAAAALLKTLGVHQNDVMHIVPGDKGSIGIEAIREIGVFLYSQPLHGHIHAACIFHAEAMTTAAQNALLKTLEEPPPSARIVLTTTSPDGLLDTIKSRCECIRTTASIGDTMPTTHFDLLYELPPKIGAWMQLVDAEVKTRDAAVSFIDAVIRDAMNRLNEAKTDDVRTILVLHLSRMVDAKKALRANAPFKLCLDSLIMTG